jgi:hypothetical protein
VKQKTGLVLPTLASGQFLMTPDSSVMNVSIATVAKDVGTTVTGIQTAITRQNPDVPPEVTAQANVELAHGIPFISDADLETALEEAGATAEVSQAVLDENQQARLDGLRTALAALALIALIGLFFASRIPTRKPGAMQRRAAPQQA